MFWSMRTPLVNVSFLTICSPVRKMQMPWRPHCCLNYGLPYCITLLPSVFACYRCLWLHLGTPMWKEHLWNNRIEYLYFCSLSSRKKINCIPATQLGAWNYLNNTISREMFSTPLWLWLLDKDTHSVGKQTNFVHVDFQLSVLISVIYIAILLS